MKNRLTLFLIALLGVLEPGRITDAQPGYADIVVGMPRANGTGLAEVFAGGSTGLSDIPLWTHDGFQAGSNFGSAVACAGDVNGDGLSDVLVGAMLHDVGGTNNGGAMLFLGPLPAGAPTAWFTASPLDNAQFGAALANAGDTNGDGWSDIVVGSPKYSTDLSRQGHVDLYLGATGIGRLRYTRPTRTAGSVALRGPVDAHSFGFASIATSPAGRTQLKLQAPIELPPFFPGPPRDEVQPAFTPTGGPGTFGSFAFLVQSVGALGTGAPFSWRSRALTRSLYFPTTTWAMPVRNGPREYDLRTPGSWVGAPDEVVQAREFALAPPWPYPTRSVSHVAASPGDL